MVAIDISMCLVRFKASGWLMSFSKIPNPTVGKEPVPIDWMSEKVQPDSKLCIASLSDWAFPLLIKM
jgi:hypothetical protein